MATVTKQRAFLDAAASGDLVAVDAWLSSEDGGDVNATMGEGWTALLYAVANSRLNVVRRLMQEETVDLNATTITGSSALTMALSRKNNSLAVLLLTGGASRATLSIARWQELRAACWVRADLRQMLSPDWTVTWTPALHRHFPPSEREKCRLVVYANVLAMRQYEELLRRNAGWKSDVTQRLWWMAAALTGRSAADNRVRWRYLPQQLVDHIIEYAVYLW